jgi:site-specific DNA-methyltransferase (adenine-specific)
LSAPIVAGPQSACSETYIVAGVYDTAKEAKNAVSYLNTVLVRFLILLIKNTQDVPRKVYKFVPMQDFSQPWTDEKLYKKYGITEKEKEFMLTLVRPIE